MICAGNHSIESCPNYIPKNQLPPIASRDKTYVICANCGQNHPATFTGCEARKKFLTVQQKLANRNKRPLNQVPFNVNDILDFPSLNNKNNFSFQSWSQPQQNNNHINGQINGQATESSLMNLMETLKSLINTFQNMMNQMTQIMSLFTNNFPNPR